MFDSRLNGAWWALRIGLGLSAFLAGLDKFFGLLADWEAYLSPLAAYTLARLTEVRDAAGATAVSRSSAPGWLLERG